MIDREELAAELSKNHGIRIEADDPIIVAALLNRRLLDEALLAIETTVNATSDRTAAAAVQQTETARQIAAALITQAGEWSGDRLSLAAREASATMTAELGDILARVDRSRRMAVRAALVAVCVSILLVTVFLGRWLTGTCRI
jgi:CHASE3 domain sensor protein